MFTLTDWFSVNSGTGQGDIQGPPVINFCLNFSAYLMEQKRVISRGATLQRAFPGVEEKDLLDTDYADDMALLHHIEECWMKPPTFYANTVTVQD